MGYLLTVRRLGWQGSRRKGCKPAAAVVATFLIETEGEGMLQQQLPFWMLMHFFLHSCNSACSDQHKYPFMFIFAWIRYFFRLSSFLMIWCNFNAVYVVSIANLRRLLTFLITFFLLKMSIEYYVLHQIDFHDWFYFGAWSLNFHNKMDNKIKHCIMLIRMQLGLVVYTIHIHIEYCYTGA